MIYWKKRKQRKRRNYKTRCLKCCFVASAGASLFSGSCLAGWMRCNTRTSEGIQDYMNYVLVFIREFPPCLDSVASTTTDGCVRKSRFCDHGHKPTRLLKGVF